jgi:DNA-binding transcriptional MerR regulator
MRGYSISQVAERTGFAASTLRFYDQQGLVRPARTPAGYRSYGDRDLVSLGFIGRAKSFGLSLEEITELLTLFEQDRCAPVQDRLRALVTDKIADARDRIAELESFILELQRAVAALGADPPDGPCDETCGCTTESRRGRVTIALSHLGDAQPPIACSLDSEGLTRQVGEWQQLLGMAERGETTPDGARFHFSRDIDVAAIAALVDAEQRCCRFFTFALNVTDVSVVLDITAPAEAQTILHELFGARV